MKLEIELTDELEDTIITNSIKKSIDRIKDEIKQIEDIDKCYRKDFQMNDLRRMKRIRKALIRVHNYYSVTEYHIDTKQTTRTIHMNMDEYSPQPYIDYDPNNY